MSDVETFTQYGVFVQHGSAEILQAIFGGSEAVATWRTAYPHVHVTSIRTRQVTKQISMWSEPIVAETAAHERADTIIKGVAKS